MKITIENVRSCEFIRVTFKQRRFSLTTSFYPSSISFFIKIKLLNKIDVKSLKRIINENVG
jgi:hypothetical protein